MKDIICECGFKMNFICYISTAGENANLVMRGLYKCPVCKNTEYIITGWEEYHNDVYTNGYVEYCNEMSKSNRDATIQFFAMMCLCIIAFFITMYYIT